MKITKKSFYAIQALLYLNNNPGKIISSAELCEKQNLPKPCLQTIFSKLANEEITESIKGPTGGHKLKVKASDLTIWKIMHSIGELNATKRPENKSDAAEFGIVEDYLNEFDNIIETKLLSLTLHDVAIGNFDVSSIVEKESNQNEEKILEENNPELSEEEN